MCQSTQPIAPRECPTCGKPVPKKRLGQKGNQRKYCEQCKPKQPKSVEVDRQCVDCGEIIPRSGKRGPLRKRCLKCQPRDEQGNRLRLLREQQCIACQKWFVGPKRKYCSKKCHPIATPPTYDKTCVQCGRDFVAKRPEATSCSPRCRMLTRHDRAGTGSWFECQRCGKRKRKKKVGNRANLFCGRDCAYAYRADHGHYGKPRSKAINPYAWRAVSDGAMYWLKRWRPCRKCNRSFYSMHGQQYCSADCIKVERLEFQCKRCGVDVTSTKGNRLRLCKRCAKRRQSKLAGKKHKERADRYGVAYEPIDAHLVFKRDKWKCGICGRKTSKSKPVPHKRAPTLDHIIPMSKGGGHLYNNVQCACFECNTNASNRMNGKQLRLV